MLKPAELTSASMASSIFRELDRGGDAPGSSVSFVYFDTESLLHRKLAFIVYCCQAFEARAEKKSCAKFVRQRCVVDTEGHILQPIEQT